VKEAETKFIDDVGAKEMCFRKAEKAVADRKIHREIQVGGAEVTAREGLQAGSTEGQMALVVGEEETL
jgi:hypothetical protein